MIWHTYHNVGSYSYDIILNIPCIAYTIFANCITMFSFIALHLNMQYVQHVQLEALHRSAGRWCPALCSTQRWDATHAFDSPEASSSACCSCLATIPISSFKKKTNFNSTFDCNWSFLELCRLRNSDSNGTAINMSTLLPASHTHQALLKTPREQSRKLVEGERWCNILKWPLRSQYHSLSFQPFPPLEWVKPLKPPRWYLVSMPFEGYPCKTQTKGLCPQPIQLQILWFLSQNSIYRKTIYAGVLFSKSSPGFAPLQCLKDVWRFLLIEFIGRLTFPAPSSPRTKGHFQVIFHSTNWNLWEYTDLNPLSSHLGDDISDFKKWYWYLIATELPIGTIFLKKNPHNNTTPPLGAPGVGGFTMRPTKIWRELAK